MFDRSPAPKMSPRTVAGTAGRASIGPMAAIPVRVSAAVPFDIGAISIGGARSDGEHRGRYPSVQDGARTPSPVGFGAVPPAAPLQRMVGRAGAMPTSVPDRRAPRPDHVGLPHQLGAGVESLPGAAMDEVRVRYRSPEPARFGASAFARGRDIHAGPGQERHSPDEARHVVQQAQGRAEPKLRVDGAPIDDRRAFGIEADRFSAGSLTTARKTPAEPSGAGGGTVMQLKVVEDTESGEFFSDAAPDQRFATREEAEQFEASIEAPRAITGGRSATLFTYTSTPSHRKLSSLGIPQGPHTVGHAATQEALFATKGNIDIESVIAEQTLHPDMWADAVRKEAGKDIFDGKTEESKRYLRAYKDYIGLHNHLNEVMDQEVPEEEPLGLVQEMIQLNPHAVYKYTDPGSVTKADLKYKGENSDLSDPKNVDRRGRFKDNEGYQNMIEDRASMLDYDFKPDNEASDTDEMLTDGSGDEGTSDQEESSEETDD